MKSEDDKNLKDQLFLIQFEESIDQKKFEEATQLFVEAETQGIVARSLWQILPILFAKLNAEDENFNPNVCDMCANFLSTIANNCNPKETLLLITERAKDVKDETTFRCLLEPLRNCLIRSGVDKGIDWCVGSIKNYIKSLPQPENKKPQTEEIEASEELDQVEERLIKDFQSILPILKLLTTSSTIAEAKQTKTTYYALSFHLFLFGYPFCYLNSTKIASIYQTLFEQMYLLTGNLLKFHEIIKDRSLNRRIKNFESEEEEEDNYNIEVDLFRNEENVSDLAYANYYYYLLTSEEVEKNIPQIYNPHYLMHSYLYLSNFMLKQPEYILVSKGLLIAEAILKKIDKSSIGHEFLEFSVHHDLCASLAQVMIYCDADKDRKMALNIFQTYIDRFNIRARYLVLINLYETANHSGFLSLLTNITKSSIIHCLNHNCDYFLGGKLKRLIKRICRLPNGSASDLVEISDEVITALNLLRFLTIRDKDNSTGIWQMIDYLERDYLEPLRMGIKMSMAHWKETLSKSIEEQNKNIDNSAEKTGKKEKETMEEEITVSVGGQNLPMMPIEEKIKFCLHVINALDIMESIVIRVNECIEENSLRNH